jgi:hypothetical protein
VLGILSIVFCSCGWILGPVTWILARGDLKKIDAGEIAREAEQNTKIGMYCGIAGTVLGVLWLLGVCIYAIVVLLFLGTAPTQIKKTALFVEPVIGLLC